MDSSAIHCGALPVDSACDPWRTRMPVGLVWQRGWHPDESARRLLTGPRPGRSTPTRCPTPARLGCHERPAEGRFFPDMR